MGYYVNNEYDSEELNAEPPAKPIMERVRRNILAEKPRVTRFAIKWSVWTHDVPTIKANTDDQTGIRKTPHRQNTHPNSQKPTSSKMTASHMAPKKSSSRRPS